MDVSIQDVQKMAELARLELSPAEEQRHAQTISAVFDYMKILNEVDTNGVEPTYQVTGLENVTRPDVAQEYPDRQKLVECFPEREGAELVVPGVFSNN